MELAIAKAIIDQHNGKIYAKSVINENTTFTFNFLWCRPSPKKGFFS